MPCRSGQGECYEPSRYTIMENKAYDAEKKNRKLIGMLCALCVEVYDAGDFDLLADAATVNGDCDDIREWFKDHLAGDIQRIQIEGLPSNASRHEKALFKRLKENHVSK